MAKTLNLIVKSLLPICLALQPADVKAENYVSKAKKLIGQGACADAIHILKNTNTLKDDPVDGNVELAKAYSCELREGFSNAILNGNSKVFGEYSKKEKELERVIYDLSLLDDDFDVQSLSYKLGYLIYNGKAQKSRSFNTPLDAAKTFIYSLLSSDNELLDESKSRTFLESESRYKGMFQKNLAVYKKRFENPGTRAYLILVKNASESRIFKQFGSSYIVYSVITKGDKLGELALIVDKEGSKYKISNIQ